MMLDFDNQEIYALLLNTCKKYSVNPSSSLHAESFFRELLTIYPGTSNIEEIVQWLEEMIANNFICIKERPKWIQGPEWPFSNGRPMLFVGQIDVSINDNPLLQVFHDDTSFYLFITNDGETTVITQQY